MKNKTIISEKHIMSRKKLFHIFLAIFCSLLSIATGFLISYFGLGNSYIETGMITAVITLFGFGLSSTVFVYQAFKEKEDVQVRNVIKSLTNTLLLIFILILVAVLFDFICSLDINNIAIIVFNTIKFAALIYALICQIDILLCFIIIIRNKQGS